MAPTAPPGPRAFTRRTLLAASAAGFAVTVAGCTSSSSADEEDSVTSEQADELAAQVTVQKTLVAAYDMAFGADPALATAVADLATQAAEQLERLRAAAPGDHPAGEPMGSPPAGAAQGWLRAQVAVAATSHATACLDQSGARAALLGSIAAGLRGHEARLA